MAWVESHAANTESLRPFDPPGAYPISRIHFAAGIIRKTCQYFDRVTSTRELPGKLTMEVGYLGRLSRRLLMEGDVYTPLENYKDPASGVTWRQNAQIVYEGGAPSFAAGLIQVNALIPATISPGVAVPVIVNSGASASQAAITIAVK